MRKKEEKKTEVTECLPSTYQGREIFHQMGECLNPYYTGIHLHILIIKLLNNVCSIGVNI